MDREGRTGVEEEEEVEVEEEEGGSTCGATCTALSRHRWGNQGGATYLPSERNCCCRNKMSTICCGGDESKIIFVCKKL